MNLDWEALRAEAQGMHERREAALILCRSLIQLSSRAIRCVHRRDASGAAALLGEAKAVAQRAREALGPYPELYYAGYLQDAEKELAEAAFAFAMAGGGPCPSRAELGVGLMAYLHGAGEAASEIRRYLLDELRGGDAAGAEALLGQMETVYDELSAFDFPDGMTGGLRRTNDALRAVVERTRSDLTATVAQERLLAELRAAREANRRED